MHGVRRFSFLLLLFLTLTLVSQLAYAVSFHGIPYETLQVRATDSTELSVFHLKGNEKGPVILLEPGLVETAEMLDGIAASFHEAGYEVFIGQVRLAGRGESASGKGIRNGLAEVTLFDFPAHLREVVRRANGREIHLLGHSMGGIEILAAFSNEALAAEFLPHVKAVTLLTAPHDLAKLPWLVRTQTRVVLPALKAARALLKRASLGPHHTFFDVTKKLKGSKRAWARNLATAIENAAIQVGTMVLNHTLVSINHTTPEALRRLWFKEVSALPLDLLIDFGEAVLRGYFVDFEGRPLIVPEKVKVPTQVIRAERDYLVPWEHQLDLFRRLGAGVKRLISLRGMLHVDPVVADRPEANFLAQAVQFHDKPALEAANEPHIVFMPSYKHCEQLLK